MRRGCEQHARRRFAARDRLLDRLGHDVGSAAKMAHWALIDAGGHRGELGVELFVGIAAVASGAFVPGSSWIPLVPPVPVASASPTVAIAVLPNSVVIRPGSTSTTSTPKPRTSKRRASLIAS